MPSTNPHGKTSCVEIPARDVALSSQAYAQIFRSALRARGDGAVAFDNSTA
jgi:hypothetical protein